MRSLKKVVSELLLILPITACVPPENTDLSPLSQPPMGNEGALSQGASQLCIVNTAGVMALTDTQMQISGNASVDGNVYLVGRGAHVDVTGNGSISQTLFRGADTTARTSGNGHVNAEESVDLSNVEANVRKAATWASDQEVTDDRESLSGVIEASARLNVLKVQDLRLSGKDRLGFNGTDDQYFVVNVAGDFNLSGQSSIVLSGGLKPENVIFNIEGQGSAVTVSGQASVSGTLLAVDRDLSVTGRGKFAGMILGGGSSLNLSGNGFVLAPAPFCFVDHSHDGNSGDDPNSDGSGSGGSTTGGTTSGGTTGGGTTSGGTTDGGTTSGGTTSGGTTSGGGDMPTTDNPIVVN